MDAMRRLFGQSNNHLYEAIPEADPEEPRAGGAPFALALPRRRLGLLASVLVAIALTSAAISAPLILRPAVEARAELHGATYHLTERQGGASFLKHYTFYSGDDAAGSSGYQSYVDGDLAARLGLVRAGQHGLRVEALRPNATLLESLRSLNGSSGSSGSSSSSGSSGSAFPRLDGRPLSVRLEGRTRFNDGLFVVDVAHVPTGCGSWPAVWLVDEEDWPKNGEVDIVEAINTQSVAKTALHSGGNCSMHSVPVSAHTGTWDTATGVPDSRTGLPSADTVSATDCFAYAPKQWLNQGCVAVSDQPGTLGGPLNADGGGLFVLEWDPEGTSAALPEGAPPGPAGEDRPPGGFMRAWAFVPRKSAPENLLRALKKREAPAPDAWPLPYAYFRLDADGGCAPSHFRNLRLVVNLAFCGAVAGTKFHLDCPRLSTRPQRTVQDCEAYVRGDAAAMDEAFWEINGIQVFRKFKATDGDGAD